MTRTLTEQSMPKDLRKGLMQAFKRHLKGRRPTTETVAAAAFFVGYLFQLTERDDLTADDLAALVHGNIEAGSLAAVETIVATQGGRQ